MNKGLKSYTKQHQISLEGIGEAYINLYKGDANLIFNIPLISTISKNPISVGIIYNHQNRNTVGECGYGINTTLYRRISESGSGVNIKNADGTEDYTGLNTYNKELGITATSYEIDSEGTLGFELRDKYGNYLTYTNENNQIETNYHGKKIRLVGNRISNDYGEYVDRSYTNGMLSNLQYYINNTLIRKVELVYTNNKVTRINYYKGTTQEGSITIAYGSNNIVLKNTITNKTYYFEYSSNEVTRVITDYQVSGIGAAYTYSYNTYETVILDSYNNKNVTRFNSNGFCVTEKTNKNMRSYIYNSDKELKYVSDVVSPSIDRNKAMNQELLTSYGGSVTNTALSSELSELGYTREYQVSGNGTLTKELDIPQIKGESFLAYFMIKLISGVPSIEIGGVTANLDTTYNTGMYYMIPIGKYIEESSNKIVITITLSNCTFYMSDILIMDNLYGESYEFDSYSNITKLTNNNGIRNMTYTNNLITQEVYDDVTTNYIYNNNKNLINVSDSLSRRISMGYDDDNNMKTKEEYIGNIKVSQGKEYTALGQVKSVTNEFGNKAEYSYNEDGSIYLLGNIKTPTMRYTYDSKGRVAKVEELTAYMSSYDPGRGISLNYGYDSGNGKMNRVWMTNSDISSPTSANSTYDFTYNNKGQPAIIKQDNVVIHTNEYSTKGELTKEIYGNGDNKTYTYEAGKLKNLKENGVVKTTINYNAKEEIESITNNGLQTNYQYDNKGRLRQKRNTSQTTDYVYNNKDELEIETNKVGNKTIVRTVKNRKDLKRITTKVYDLDTLGANYEFYPFTTLQSNKSRKPYNYTGDYNTSLNNEYYQPNGNILVYKLGTGNSGVVSFDFSVSTAYNKNTLMYMYNNSTVFELYLNSSRKLYLKTGGSTYDCGIYATTGGYNKLIFSYERLEEEAASSGDDPIIYYEFKVYLNGSSTTKYNYTEFYVGDLKTIIGTNLSNNQLNGSIKNMLVKNGSLEANEVSKINNIKETEYVRKYDELGRTKEIYIVDNNKQVYSNKYSYENIDTSTTTKRVTEEEIKTPTLSTYRTYGYNNSGYVTSVYSPTEFYSENYGYDQKGRLSIEGTQTGYNHTYDSNGNIRNKRGNTYTYDSTIKDRLISYNGNTIGYSATDPFLPTSYNGYTYTYEGRKLKTVTKNGVTTTYNYNESGQRISKTGKQYYYSGNRLIAEVGSNYRLDFIYENDIVGFILTEGSSVNRYYYVVDSLKTIIGIIDESGELVVKYNYDAYGMVTTTGPSESSIGALNPIRYKGYYYDVETQLFYCNSRYYSPELCRFISPDSIEYLDPQSINGLNLYCYCMNNPIMYADPSGHSVILAMLIGAGIGLVVGLGSQLASDVISNVITNGFDFSEWEMSSWQTYVGAGLGGAIGGALTPFLGPVATGFITGASSTAISMGLSNITGASNYSLGEIFATSLLIGSVSGITAGILDNVKIPGINSGRGSLTAVSKQINTKLVNGSIKNVSIKTIGKMAALNAIYSAPFTLFNGLFTNGAVISPAY